MSACGRGQELTRSLRAIFVPEQEPDTGQLLDDGNQSFDNQDLQNSPILNENNPQPTQQSLEEILIVDDTPANLRLLANLLTQNGYRVRPASSGKLALKSTSFQVPDLIMLDIRMPHMDGYEVCRLLKADEKTKDIPVIFLSAMDDSADKAKAFEAGAVDFISKPFQAVEILARIRTHLELQSLKKQIQSQ
ncbi:MAG: response regulator [Magnetococcales bacterium]|nr:response regulator [Magnetococcales bacterium]